MQIKILKVTDENRGKYNMLNVAFVNLANNKVDAKNIPSFAESQPAYEALRNASVDDVFNISTARNPKNDKYVDWVQAVKGEANESVGGTATEAAPAATRSFERKGSTTGGRDYESKDERAARQVLIVRQSSLSAAVEVLGSGRPSVDYTKLAEEFTAWVFQKPSALAGLKAMTDDVPV